MRYLDLAEMIIEAIISGKIIENDRMPSLRTFKSQHNVSMTTALNCYRHLESLGWLIAKPQSGYFICEQRKTHEQPDLITFKSTLTDPQLPRHITSDMPNTLNIENNKQADLKSPGPLCIARMSAEFIPVDKLQQSFRRSLKRQGNNVSDYPAPQGERTLRDILSEHFAKYDFKIPSDELIITNSCMDSIQTAIETCTNTGDTIAISSPCFNGLLELLATLKRKVIEIPSTEQGIDLKQLEQHMKKKQIKAGLFCTSHMNPQGISMSALQKQHLVTLAETYKIPIIEDDVYLELAHNKVTPLPAKHWDKHGYVLWCGSISKTIAAGYRLGWCWPGRYAEKYLERRKYCTQGISTPIQLAIADFIGTGEYSKHLKKLRFAMQQQTLSYQNYLAENLPATSKISAPTGGFVLWIQVPNLDGKKLFTLAKSHHIDIRIGEQFSSRNLYPDYFRLNVGFPLKQEGSNEDKIVDKHLEKLMLLIKEIN